MPPSASSIPRPARCSSNAPARPAGIDPFDATGRIGLLHVAFPLKMLLQPDGHLTSCDILHTVAGAIIFDVYENQDARLVALQIPERVMRTFPGPAYGPLGVRAIAPASRRPARLRHDSETDRRHHAEEVGALVEEAAHCPLFLFVKEDENLYPELDYSPVAERTRLAVAAIKRARGQARRTGA